MLLHIESTPLINEGVAGKGVILMVAVCAALLPHPLLAVTETIPPFASAIALMLLLVDVPDHVPGSVHV